jgi:hypothetical protein
MMDFIWDTIKGAIGFLILLGIVFLFTRLHDANETKTEFNIAREGAKGIRSVFDNVSEGWSDTTAFAPMDTSHIK